MQQGIFVRENAGSFGYNDGDSVEENLRNLIHNASDRSVYSGELASSITDWPTLYHLSPQRSALLVPFIKHIKGKKVLEIGCGLGAITRALAEFGANVTALDGSFRRVSIAAERCGDFPEVKFYCDNFEDFELDEKFDLVTLTGVLEYAAMFFKADHPCEAMLKKAKSFLRPGGRLLLAIENKLGIKYFNNAPEDHVDVPFYGIQGLYEEKGVRTYGKKELSALLKNAGYDKFSFHYPFPDYKLPTLYLHPAAFSAPGLNVPDLLHRNMPRRGLGEDLFYEETVAGSLYQNGLLEDFANSFVVLTGEPDEAMDDVCATRISPDRKKETASVVQIVKDGRGFTVSRSTATGFILGDETARKRHPYLEGELFSSRLQKQFARKCCGLDDLVNGFSPCVDFLKEHRIPGTETLPPGYWDCTPFNLLVQDTKLVFFDQEVPVKEAPVPIAFVIFRGILYTLGDLSFLNLKSGLPRHALSLTKTITNAFGFTIGAGDFLAEEYEIQKCKVLRVPSDFELYRSNIDRMVFPRQQNDELNDVRQKESRQQERLDAMQQQVIMIQQKNLELYSSNFFRAFNRLHDLYVKLFPRESKRGKVVQTLVTFGINLYRALKKGRRVNLNECRDYSIPYQDKYPFKQNTSKKLTVPLCDNPRLSIVIPVYNQFVYTYSCVKSVIENCKGIPYEIIIADDCSTDETKDIADRISNVKVCRTEQNVRFLLNCNHAAESAKGEFILFLNNDTVVHPGWLSALVETMDRDPEVGIVGAKLVYPSGKLQEAGGIIFRDASGWNYGNGDNPDAPEYNYLKECDYTSGASLMIRTTLWKEIGGFDKRFVPSYYEDTDLCFEARRHGYKVIYQPKAVVTHFEGRSNGTDVSGGLKKYQVDNQVKFADKWKEVLAEHCINGDNAFTARDRSSKKQHIFMLDHYVPTFDKDAGSRQMYCYISILQKHGYMIHLLGDNRLHDEPYTGAFQQLGVEVLYGAWYAPRELMNWFRKNNGFLDYAFLNRAHIACDYFPIIRRYPDIKLVYYGHDVGHIRLQREYEVTGDKNLLSEISSSKVQELALYSSSDAVMCVGDFECSYLKKNVPDIPVYNMPIFVYDHFPETCEPFENRKDILFVGGFNHRPNKDGVLWFVREVLPSVIERIPDVRFHIAGSNMPDELKKMAGEHIVIEGFVSDEKLEYLYRSSRIVVAPLRFGAGVKGKIIEALYNRSAVVTTSIGAEGIPSDNHPFAVADSAADFADAVVNAYTDRKLWESFLENSLAMIKATYSYENAVNLLLEIFSKQR